MLAEVWRGGIEVFNSSFEGVEAVVASEVCVFVSSLITNPPMNLLFKAFLLFLPHHSLTLFSSLITLSCRPSWQRHKTDVAAFHGIGGKTWCIRKFIIPGSVRGGT